MGSPKPRRQIRSAESGVAVHIRVVGLTDDFDARRKVEIGMKRGAGCALHAMRRPWPASRLETNVPFRMPVPRRIDRNALPLRLFKPFVQNRHNLAAFGDGQRAARTKVILYID